MDSANEVHAYVRAANGTFTSFDPPFLPPMEDASARRVKIGGINNHGDLSGSTRNDGWSDGTLPFIKYAGGTFKTFPGVDSNQGDQPATSTIPVISYS